MPEHKQFPIIINKSAVVVVNLFKRYMDTLDFRGMWLHDLAVEFENDENYFQREVKKSAKEYIDCLEGEQCDLFLYELIDVCIDKISNCDKKYNTHKLNHLKERIENKMRKL